MSERDPLAALLAAALSDAPDADPVEPPAQTASFLLDEWETRGWIELTPDADRSLLRPQLEALAESGLPALLDAIFDLDGIEELYASDDDLESFLKDW